MKTIKTISLLTVVLSLILTGCSAAPTIASTAIPTTVPTTVPTIEPTAIDTNTPIPAPTDTETPLPTATATATELPTATDAPKPVCLPNNTVAGSPDEKIPGYLDIISVSSTLEGTKFTAVFTMRDIPDEITIDSNNMKKGIPELAVGVDIDSDVNEDTGGSNFMFGSGYGYDYALQAFNFKQGNERKGAIEKLLKTKTNIWKVSNGNIKNSGIGKITVDQATKTITLSASIPGIKPESYVHFYTFFNNGEDKEPSVDELCGRLSH